MKLRYPLLSLLGLGSYVVHAQQGLPAPVSGKAAATTLDNGAGTRLDTGFEEDTETSISGSHLQPVHSATYARTGQTSLLLASGGDKAYFSLSKLLPVKANQRITARLYASYSGQPHTVDRVLQAAALAAAAYSQSQPTTPALPEQAARKRAVPYLGLGIAFTPTVKSWSRATPKAYLRYSVYNADTVLVSSDIRPITRAARDNWQELSFAQQMPVDGFVQLTFVNESPQPVRVDDLSLLVDAGTPAPAPKFKGVTANNFGSQASGNCLPADPPPPPPPVINLPEFPVSGSPPSDPYPPIPPIYFPDPPYDPNPNPYPDYPDGSGDYPIGYEPVSPTEIIIDPAVPSCVQGVIQVVKNAANPNGVASIFNFLTGHNNVVLFMQMGYVPLDAQGRQTNAFTQPGLNTNEVKINFNPDFTNTATNVAIARTLIHESLHAYLYVWAGDHGFNLNSTTSQLVDAYLGTTYGGSNIADQHNAMATLVNQMSTYLISMFPYLPSDYAKNLFWSGLTETDAYAALSNTQKSAITAANTAEVLSQPSAMGAKACP